MAEMIEHKGVVLQQDGHMAKVRIEQVSACAACHAKGACMAADSAEKIIDCQMVEPLEVGEEVVVKVARQLGMTAVLLAFVVPFVLLLAIVFGLGQVIESEAITGTIALVALLPYYGILALLKGKLQKRFSFYAFKKTTKDTL